MLIPDLKLYQIVKFFIDYTYADYENDVTSDKSKNILYDLFNTDDVNEKIVLEKMDFLKQAISIFYTRDVESPSKINVSIGYNLERAQLPHIHIMLANKSKGRFDSIGLSQGEFPETFDVQNQMVVYDKVRTFAANVAFVITGASVAQVIIIQYFLESLLDMFHEKIGLIGLLNMNYSSQDTQLFDQFAQKEIFTRMIMAAFDYQSQIKCRQFMEMADSFDLRFCSNLGDEYDDYIVQ